MVYANVNWVVDARGILIKGKHKSSEKRVTDIFKSNGMAIRFKAPNVLIMDHNELNFSSVKLEVHQRKKVLESVQP